MWAGGAVTCCFLWRVSIEPRGLRLSSYCFQMKAQVGGWHEELLKRRKANTYKERRKEGRTLHTKSSKTSITIAVIALIFNGMAFMMPHWRSSWAACTEYVHGRTLRNFAVACLSPTLEPQQRHSVTQLP
eukprot:Skav235893  [mRNA]  locus=scaffold256:7233:9759:+ [translate_table: standard]